MSYKTEFASNCIDFQVILKKIQKLGVPPTPEIILINFTINGESYQAEEGMTWYNWCSTEYNTDNYGYGDDGIFSDTDLCVGYADQSGYVQLHEVISPNGEYSLYRRGI